MTDFEIERIQSLLPTNLFEGSKDWREGSLAERVEWLLSMYQSSKQEEERLEVLVYELTADWGLKNARIYFLGYCFCCVCLC